MKNIWSILFLAYSFTTSYGQLSIPDTIPVLFAEQLKIFPQEKIHLHTDKPYYLAGEKAWFRAHVADASIHVPVAASRYVYVELIDPLDSVLVRLKIRPDSTSYHGYISIPEDAPEGSYELRAYTNFMRSVGEEYFCTKSIGIARPQSQDIRAGTPFRVEPDKKVSVNDDFDVTFFPEGGAMLSGPAGRVAFKALKSNGQTADVTGKVYDNEGVETLEFKSEHSGMGSFTLQCVPGKSYHAIVKTVESEPKRFDLPAVQTRGYALSTNWVRNKLYVSVLESANMTQQDDLFLIAHTRGLVHFAAGLEKGREFVQLQKDLFPSGVLHLLLLDASMKPLSERLVFVDNDDQAHVAYHSSKDNYPARAWVENTVVLTDKAGNPLTGNFSVAVTDDQEVQTDTTSNILTTLLLTSDLHGNIENPSFYFRENSKSAWALDLLMSTQGWRRYDTNKILKGDFSKPTSYLEVGPEISGLVKSVSVFGGKPLEGLGVTALSLTDGYFETTTTNKDGHFHLNNSELPDSTRIIVQTMPKRGGVKEVELVVNTDQYPARTLQPPLSVGIDQDLLAKYVSKAEQQYTLENGMRMIHLDEVSISAKRKKVHKSIYYSQADNSLTEDQIGKFTPTDMRNLLVRLPGVMVAGGRISIRGQNGDPLLIVDGVMMDISEIDNVSALDVAQVDVLKNATNTAIFGSRGGNGVIVVFTKEGKVTFKQKAINIKSIVPLGYQTPVEFYAPKYDVSKVKENQAPDFRTTIFWQPNVLTDSTGKASFGFYSADDETSYSVVIEGLTIDGQIIRQEGKIERTVK